MPALAATKTLPAEITLPRPSPALGAASTGNARSEVTFQVKGEDKIYTTAALLQPKDRKQEGYDNDYVQQRHVMGSFGSAVLSFERSKVPLSFSRTAVQGAQSDGTKTKLRVHVEEVE